MDQSLKTGTLLRDTYRIERVLGQGGFGITYLALDETLDIHVAVKEYFPKSFCVRDDTTSHVAVSTPDNAKLVSRFKDKFLKEARSIAKLKHPNIIKIYAAFEENDTAYYVMEYIDGISLSEMVRNNGPLSENRAMRYINQIGSALDYIHGKSINHLDVKPGNIMLRSEDDTPILIDFGLAKQYDDDGQQTSTTPVGISHGYAPLEQYSQGGVSSFSPATDVYSLAATLYYLLSGVVPLRAPDLANEMLSFPDSIPHHLAEAIGKAMSLAKFSRQQSVAQFLQDLKEEEADGGFEAPVEERTVVASLMEKPESLTPPLKPGVTTFTVNGVSFDMVDVEGGSFMMGSDDADAYDDERPAHYKLVESFAIGKTVVTQALWKAVMGSRPSYFSGDNLPVESVSWDECQEFISKLNNLTGKRFRLPTEAEWEYAARGGNRSKGYKYSGSDEIDKVSWYEGNSGNTTHSVATKSANELGLYDMSGNIGEWTSDIWSIDNNSQNGILRYIRRGGCWNDNAKDCRTTYRCPSSSRFRFNYIGMRLAL